jgi:NAD(P)-dependent dehydrogenase (short-subunit alcohol dehydrogenase family)
MTSSALSGQTALVTGSTSGIGRATADALADLGAYVLVSGRDTARGEKAVAEIRATGGKADFIAADLSTPTGPHELAQAAITAGGGHVDILVNNAGLFPFGPTAGWTAETIDTVYAANVRAPFLLVGELAPLMAGRGHGSIVNLGSIVAKNGVDGAALYGSSKAALVLASKAWSAEYGPAGVRVNAVSPGPILTEGTAAMGEAGALDALAAGTPTSRVGTPTEVASAIAYLTTPGASYIHGADLAVDGGKAAV